MKKILFSTITFLSLVALASCGEKDKNTSTSGAPFETTTIVPTTTVDTTTAPTHPMRMAFMRMSGMLYVYGESPKRGICRQLDSNLQSVNQ